MPDTARIAVIGTGWWSTTAHIPVLQANPNANLVALADVRADVLDKAARHYGVERTYTDIREMLAREQLDGVVIAVWHAAHYEAARACLEQGLHVVLEKPMTLLAAHARHLTELSRERGCQLIIGYPWNYNPHVLRVKEVISSGRLGGIRYINNMFASSVISLYRGNDSVHDNLYAIPGNRPRRCLQRSGALGRRPGPSAGDPFGGADAAYDGAEAGQRAGVDGQSRYTGGCR